MHLRQQKFRAGGNIWLGEMAPRQPEMGSHPTGRGLLSGTELIGIIRFRIIEFLLFEQQLFEFVVSLVFFGIVERLVLLIRFVFGFFVKRIFFGVVFLWVIGLIFGIVRQLRVVWLFRFIRRLFIKLSRELRYRLRNRRSLRERQTQRLHTRRFHLPRGM